MADWYKGKKVQKQKKRDVSTIRDVPFFLFVRNKRCSHKQRGLLIVPIVVLDPGHGGADPGASGNGLVEKNLTLAIALNVANFLRKIGVDVRLTRTTDVSLSLSERAAFANGIGADFFLSIHINAGGGTGFESFIYSGEVSDFTVSARHVIHEKVAPYFSGFGLTNRGEKSADFAVVRETYMAAALIECGFIDNAKDALFLKQDHFLNGLAMNIASGIAKLFHLTLPLKLPERISKYYVDVVEGMEWAAPHVDALLVRGLMVGDGNGHFLPLDTVNRLTMAVVVDQAIAYVLNQKNNNSSEPPDKSPI